MTNRRNNISISVDSLYFEKAGLRHIPAAHRKVVAEYRLRIKQWAQEMLPDMPDEQWDALMSWVHAFGQPPRK
jgi:hypothetical protein